MEQGFLCIGLVLFFSRGHNCLCLSGETLGKMTRIFMIFRNSLILLTHFKRVAGLIPVEAAGEAEELDPV